MALRPTKPQKGDKVLQSLYNTVCDIVDYLPSLEVRGDNKTISVSHSTVGTTIHAVQPNSTLPSSKGNKYYAASGVALVSGNIFVSALSGDGTTVTIIDNVISAAGGGGGFPPTNGRFNTIGTGYSVNSTLSGSGTVAANLKLHVIDPPPNYYITISETANANGYNIISCDLTHLTQLYNYDFTTDPQVSNPTINTNHFTNAGDFFFSSYGNRGLGTQIGLFRYSTGNTVIDPETGEQLLVNPVMGLKVDLTLTGGTWISTSAVTRMNYGFEVDPEDLQINCLLTGTYDHYPHTSGFIDIVPTVMDDGQTWGVISTNLHAGSGIAIDQQTGEISVTGAIAPSPGGGGCPWPNYDNLGEESNTLVYPLMRYSTSTGGWLRISCRSGTSRCVGVWVGDNYYGLGTGVMTWSLAIPPGNSFYVDVDWGLNNRVWFDGTVSPSTVTLQQYQYWFTPPEYIAQSIRNNISEVRNTLNNARYEQNQCYSYMTQAKSTLNSMINDWTVHEQYEPDEDYPDGKQPKSLGWYQDSLNYIRKKLSGNYEGDSECCEYHLDQASDYCTVGATLNASLPSACPMYTYQFSDVVTRSQQYYDDIEQYITSGQYYYGLAETYWNSRE